MAPSTACSASLLQGVWRPANSDVRSVDETAGDADVIPGRFLPVRVPEQGRRMVRNDNGNAPEPVDLVAERAQRLFGVEYGLRRRPAHREDHLRLHDLDLAEQIRHARRDLVELRQAVIGRPALYDVTDEHALARQVDRAEDLGEQLAGWSPDRPSRLVFPPPRSLADHHEPRVARALARHGVPATLAQPALGAAGYQARDRVARGRLRHGIVGKQVAAGGIVGKAGGGKVGMRDARRGMRRQFRQYHRTPAQHPLLFQKLSCEVAPVAHLSDCSTASRIRSATSRLGSTGNSIGSPPFPMIVTRFELTSNPAPGSSASFRTTKSSTLSCSFLRALATPSPPVSSANPTTTQPAGRSSEARMSGVASSSTVSASPLVRGRLVAAGLAGR